MKPFPPRLGKRQECLLSLLLFSVVPEGQTSNKKRELKDNMDWRETKLLVFTDIERNIHNLSKYVSSFTVIENFIKIHAQMKKHISKNRQENLYKNGHKHN